MHLKIYIIENETTEENSTEENNITMNLDESLPTMNFTSETMISSTPSISAGNRQIRQTASYCKEFPQIEHARLLADDTIKHDLNHDIVYSGSVLFICQLGFISDSTENEPFRLTCQNGVFHPKIICIGTRCFLLIKYFIFILF